MIRLPRICVSLPVFNSLDTARLRREGENGADQACADTTQEIVEARARLRNKAKQIAIDIEGVEMPDEEDQELLNV